MADFEPKGFNPDAARAARKINSLASAGIYLPGMEAVGPNLRISHSQAPKEGDAPDLYTTFIRDASKNLVGLSFTEGDLTVSVTNNTVTEVLELQRKQDGDPFNPRLPKGQISLTLSQKWNADGDLEIVDINFRSQYAQPYRLSGLTVDNSRISYKPSDETDSLRKNQAFQTPEMKDAADIIYPNRLLPGEIVPFDNTVADAMFIALTLDHHAAAREAATSPLLEGLVPSLRLPEGILSELASKTGLLKAREQFELKITPFSWSEILDACENAKHPMRNFPNPKSSKYELTRQVMANAQKILDRQDPLLPTP